MKKKEVEKTKTVSDEMIEPEISIEQKLLEEENERQMEEEWKKQSFIDNYEYIKCETFLNLPLLDNVHIKDLDLSLTDYIIYLTILGYNFKGEMFSERNEFWEIYFNISKPQIELSLNKLRKIGAIEYAGDNRKGTGNNKVTKKRHLIANDIGEGNICYRNSDFLNRHEDLVELEKDNKKYKKEKIKNIKQALIKLPSIKYYKTDILSLADNEYKNSHIDAYNAINNYVKILDITIEDIITYLKKQKK
jgi:hypothetical protein